MYDGILVPTDGGRGAAVALEHALDIADRFDVGVHLVTVTNTTQTVAIRVLDDVIDVLVDDGDRTIELTERPAVSAAAVTTAVLEGDPADEIVAYADREDLGLVLMPTHGRRGLRRLLLGSVTERVVRTCTRPVLTLRPDAAGRLRFPYCRVLAPTDGSRCATAAVREAGRVAAAVDADLRVLSVVNTASLGVDVHSELEVDFLEDWARDAVEDALGDLLSLDGPSVEGETAFGTSVAGTVIDVVDEHDVDLVVVGTHGRSGADRYLLGSVAERLVRACPVPVLTVRADA